MRHDCGATALLSVFVYFDIFSRINDLKNETQTTPAGTTPERLVNVCIKHSLKAEFHENMTIEDLKKNIDKKLPVLISLQIKRQPFNDIKKIWSKGHYVVVVGYDKNNIYFADPRFPYTMYLDKDELNDRWHDSDNYLKLEKKRRQHYGITFSPPKDWRSDNKPKPLIKFVDELIKKYNEQKGTEK